MSDEKSLKNKRQSKSIVGAIAGKDFAQKGGKWKKEVGWRWKKKWVASRAE